MQIQNLMASAGLKTAADEGRPVDAGDDVEWKATIQRLIDADASGGGSPSGKLPPSSANLRLSELLVAHTLREIMPSGHSEESGLAFDTWRGMLADAIAQEVAPHVNVMSKVATTGRGP